MPNAVILAAGMSTRFAPLSYERPKGLMRIRGEVLIERQIRQLKEASVSDICIVAGYKWKQFSYLREKFGVSIVVNPDFMVKNSISSLWLVRDRLSDTYICSSDNYYDANPFRPTPEAACYTAQYAPGATDEWCLEIEPDGRIAGITVGGASCWYMIGHAYFTDDFSRSFVRILEQEYSRPGGDCVLWEEPLAKHVSELNLLALRFAKRIIHEFDSIDDAIGFDPRFMDEVESEVLDNITAILGCPRREIRDLYPMEGGLTNMSCHFATDAGEYVYRAPGAGSEMLVDRAAEAAAQKVAQKLGLDDTFVYQDPNAGWKISRFIANARNLDAHDDGQLRQAMALARVLHEREAFVNREFDFFDESMRYAAQLKKARYRLPKEYCELVARASRLHGYVVRESNGLCLCHNDFFELNLLLDDNDKLFLIDWEYAGMSDYASDYGTFVVTCKLSRSEADKALRYYFDREPSFLERRHNYAFVGLAGWCWYVWALLKEAEGDNVSEWLNVYYEYAEEYLVLASSMYEDPYEVLSPGVGGEV